MNTNIGGHIKIDAGWPLETYASRPTSEDPTIIDATPWPRSSPSGPTTQNPSIYVKVNSFLSMVNLNTNLNGMQPHAYHHCVYRCRHRQGPREKELPWCKEEEGGRKRKKRR